MASFVVHGHVNQHLKQISIPINIQINIPIIRIMEHNDDITRVAYNDAGGGRETIITFGMALPVKLLTLLPVVEHLLRVWMFCGSMS